jgi:hypothetical protein
MQSLCCMYVVVMVVVVGTRVMRSVPHVAVQCFNICLGLQGCALHRAAADLHLHTPLEVLSSRRPQSYTAAYTEGRQSTHAWPRSPFSPPLIPAALMPCDACGTQAGPQLQQPWCARRVAT